MAYKITTPGGYDLFVMSSMLQKAIRRADIDHAAFAAKELRGRHSTYLWKRLLVISAEDCFGIMTKEIIALKQAEDLVKGNNKGYDVDSIFLGKAILLLCMARKNRDACYICCNFMNYDRTLNPDEIPGEIDVDESTLGVDGIPDWVFDIHTREGWKRGKTDIDMIIDEQKALKPQQPSLFDEASWGNYEEKYLSKHRPYNEVRKIRKFMEGKENDPTHNGKDLVVPKPIWEK